MSNLWFNYFWASLKGNGPEALVQTVVYGMIALIFIPPFRRWFVRHMESLKAHITAEHVKIHAKMDHHEALMHHIIQNHPDIPAFKEKK